MEGSPKVSFNLSYDGSNTFCLSMSSLKDKLFLKESLDEFLDTVRNISVEDVVRAMQMFVLWRPLFDPGSLKDESCVSYEDISKRIFEKCSVIDLNSFVKGLDNSEFCVTSSLGVDLLLQTVQSVFRNPFPLECLFVKWENTSGQISFLKYISSCSADLIQFPESCTNIVTLEEVESCPPGPIKSILSQMYSQRWNCYELLSVICRIADESLSEESINVLILVIKQCPELACLGVARYGPHKASGLKAVLHKLVDGFLLGLPSSSLVLSRVWKMSPHLIIQCMVNLYNEDSSYVSRLLDVSQELRILPQVLECNQYIFAIDMAYLASRREHLNLEKWLKECIVDKKEAFMKACLDFIDCRSRSRKSHVPLSREVYVIFLRVLFKHQAFISNDSLDILKKIQLNLRIGSCSAQRSVYHTNTIFLKYFAKRFPEDIEEEAHYYYVRICSQEISQKEAISLITDLKSSKVHRELQIFSCLIMNLLEEYYSLPDYPEQEIVSCGLLLGSIIGQGIIADVQLGIALRFVLDSLRGGGNSNMFKYGIVALSKFRNRLSEWPYYCYYLINIKQISMFEDIFAIVQNTIKSHSNPTELCTNNKNMNSIIHYLPSIDEVSGEEDDGSYSNDFPSVNKVVFLKELENFYSRCGSVYHTPEKDIQESIDYIITSLSPHNIDKCISDVISITIVRSKEVYMRWFVRHFIVTKVSQDTLSHQLYFSFICGFGYVVYRYFLFETYVNIRRLLEREDSCDIDILKNLGSWLGLITMAMNYPILHRHIPLQEIIIEGFIADKSMIVIPFVCKILENCNKSKIFKPTNPWVRSILGILVEIYKIKNIKEHIKREIDTLFSVLNIKIEDMPATRIFKGFIQTFDSHNTFGLLNNSSVLDPSISVINGLTSHIVINTNAVPLFNTHPVFTKVTILSVEFSIREVSSVIIERSIGIACMTTKELVMKDFSVESMDLMKKAAQQMMQNLTGNLIMGTSREPMISSLLSNMHSFVQIAGLESLVDDNMIAIVANDNLELACAYVEKVAIEEAIRKINSILSISKSEFATFQNGPSEEIFSLIPEQLKPRSVVVTAQKLKIYDDFVRISRFQNLSNLQITSITSPNASDLDRLVNIFKPTDPSIISKLLSSRFSFPSENSLKLGHGGAVQSSNMSSINIADSTERFMRCLINIERIVKKKYMCPLATFPHNHGLQVLMKQVLVLAVNSLNRDDVCIFFAQNIIHILCKTNSMLGIEVYVMLLDKIGDLSTRVIREIVYWVIYSNDERKYNVQIIIAFILSGVINLIEYDSQLARNIESKKPSIIEFSVELVRKCVLEDPVTASPVGFSKTLTILSKFVTDKQTHLQSALVEDVRKLTNAIRDISEPSYRKVLFGLRNEILLSFNEWIELCQNLSLVDKVFLSSVNSIFRRGLFGSQVLMEKFFFIAIEVLLELLEAGSYDSLVIGLVCCYCKWVVFILRGIPHDEDLNKTVVFSKFLFSLGKHIIESVENEKNIYVYIDIVIGILIEYNNQERYFEGFGMEIMSGVYSFLKIFRPVEARFFCYGWLEILSHRFFLARLLMYKKNEGVWEMVSDLLTDLLTFLCEILRDEVFDENVKFYYKGCLRTFLLLLNDFPDFLSAYCLDFCNRIPLRCIQLRSLILCAFPRKLKLLDPFTLNIKAEMLSESNKEPVMLTDYKRSLNGKEIMTLFDKYLSDNNSLDLTDICNEVKIVSKKEMGVLSSFIVHISRTSLSSYHRSSEKNDTTLIEYISDSKNRLTHLLLFLSSELDQESRYVFLSLMTDQLRYPNSDTYYFSSVLLHIFFESTDEIVKEQITRVLLERLIVNRPHPWGLLVTFIELIKNSQYNFWNYEFTRFSYDIERLFDSVVRGCMLPTRN